MLQRQLNVEAELHHVPVPHHVVLRGLSFALHPWPCPGRPACLPQVLSQRRTTNLSCAISIADVPGQTSSPIPLPDCTRPQPPSVEHSDPDSPRQIQVALPEEPPDVNEYVAAALLHLLRALLADDSQSCPAAGDTQEERASAGSSHPSEVRQITT
jgi:hypothetical protein